MNIKKIARRNPVNQSDQTRVTALCPGDKWPSVLSCSYQYIPHTRSEIGERWEGGMQACRGDWWSSQLREVQIQTSRQYTTHHMRLMVESLESLKTKLDPRKLLPPCFLFLLAISARTIPIWCYHCWLGSLEANTSVLYESSSPGMDSGNLAINSVNNVKWKQQRDFKL